MHIIINALDATNPEGGVITAHWTVTKTDGTHTASAYGTESFTPDPDAPGFVAWDDLTSAIVASWLTDRWGTEGMAAKEAALDSQLADMANPPMTSGLPWAA